MDKIIDMQLMRYINLFRKVSGVSTMNCFVYNNQIVFAVPKMAMSKALGKGASNARKISETLRKRVKIIGLKKGEDSVASFIKDLVAPIEVGEVVVGEGDVKISGDRQSKAMLNKVFNIKRVLIQ
jgi:NusA-like KH domain protein